MHLFSVTHTQLSIYLDKTGFIAYLLMPIWPLIKFHDKPYWMRVLAISLSLWVLLYVNEWIVFQLSGYFGVRFFTGLWLDFGLFVSLAYTAILSGMISIFNIKPNHHVMYRIFNLIYVALVIAYIICLQLCFVVCILH